MSFDPDRITFFAKTDARGKSVRFGIKAKDRQRHMYVIGKTGMGKSTMLENLAVQDIQNGEGMAFIDPHGSAAETLLEYIPEERINDVVYFAPFDMEHPIAFNVMEDVGPEKRHLVVSGLMSTFKKIWVDAWSARMEYILTNALLALLEYPDSTLLSVNRMLSDKAYRKKVVENITDPAVRAYWTEEFASYTDRFAAEALPAIQNKIGQFTGNPLIRNIIGQPKSSFDLREIMDNKKILIINLSKGLVGETNANLLGSMLTTRIYLAAMSRANLSPEVMKTMPNFYFYVDEFQSFANSTFANILSEARKYHLNLVLAHQYIEQMEEEVRDAVFGNVGTTIAFRVGPFDAEVLETVYTPTFLAPDLVNLGSYQIYLTLMIDGIGSKPFSAVTLPPIDHPDISYKDVVIEASRKNFTNKRGPVEEIVAQLHESAKTPQPSKSPKKPKASKEPKAPNPVPWSERQKLEKKKEAGSVKNEKLQGTENNSPEPSEQKKQEHQENSEKEGSDKSKRGRTKRPPKKDPAKKVADLRSTLQKVVASQTDTQKSQTSGKKGRKNTPNKEDLKSAIQSALKNVPQQTQENKPDTPQQPTQSATPTPAPSPNPNPTPPQTSSPRKEPEQPKAPQLNHTAPQDPAEPKPEEKRRGNEVSPKELERMMRITTSDRPPF